MIRPFRARYEAAFENDHLATALLDFQRAWRVSRDAQIEDLETELGETFQDLRHRLAEAKRRVRAELEATTLRFTEAARARGTIVHRASSAQEAVALVGGICEDAGAGIVVKGKSMLSEEIFLNEALASSGITVVETDLGEWILQLGGERPSHIVMPAIHLRRQEVAAIFERTLGRRFDPDDIPTMVRAARVELRDLFFRAAVGVTGANFLVADTGTVGIVCNEGNNRMASAIPTTNIVVAGVDKLVPDMATALLQIRVLARSATAQTATTYTNFISGPRPGQVQHLVLIDNGRSAMAGDPGFADALACIRCGACADVCPPYQVVGGQVFGHVYSGAIGLVNTLFHHGLDAASGPQGLCVSCGACATVCPVEIPLADQILRVRRRVFEAAPTRVDRLVGWLFGSPQRFAAATRLAAALGAPVRKDRFSRLRFPRRHAGWRRPPIPPWRPARSQLRDLPEGGSGTVGLFLQCISDRVAPSIAVASAQLIEAAGFRSALPRSQHCCGLPSFDSGDWDTAAAMARRTIEQFEQFDQVVTPGTSCVVAAQHHFVELLEEHPGWAERARAFAARIRTIEDFAIEHLDRSPLHPGPGDRRRPPVLSSHQRHRIRRPRRTARVRRWSRDRHARRGRSVLRIRRLHIVARPRDGVRSLGEEARCRRAGRRSRPGDAEPGMRAPHRRRAGGPAERRALRPHR